MSRWPLYILIATFLGVACAAGWPAGAEAAGPWRGEIVDAGTGEPLEGVVILAVWDKISPGFMHPRRDYHDVDEVVTGTDGRFLIPERRLLTANPFVTLEGPHLHMFKSGYGRWRERGLGPEVDKFGVWRLMERETVSFELPRLTSIQQRRKALPSPPSDAPYSKIPRFMDAIDDEALRIGLQPYRRSREGGAQ